MNPRCYENENIDMNSMEMFNDTQAGYPNCACPPVYECPQERVCERYIVHEVPQE